MKRLSWIIRAILALLLISGGGYKVSARAALAAQFPTLSPLAWGMLGALEMVGGVLLVFPVLTQRYPAAAMRVTALLLTETAFLSVVYAQQSTALSAENPLMWSVAMCALLALLLAGQLTRLRTAGVHS